MRLPLSLGRAQLKRCDNEKRPAAGAYFVVAFNTSGPIFPLALVALVALAVLLAAPMSLRASDRDDAEAVQDRRAVELAAQLTLPRIPTRDSLLKGTDGKPDTESAKLAQWVAEVIGKKKERADAEVAEMKKKVNQDEEARLARERERQRRLARINNAEDLEPLLKEKESKPIAVRVKLEFQAPEIDTCRRAEQVCRQRKALADDIVNVLSKLDRNNDGILSADEYTDALALLIGAGRLFQQIDANEDGFLSDAEIDAARQLPRDGNEARVNGRQAASLPNARIKPYDANADGVLDGEERKALEMAFVSAALKAEKEADYYRRLGDALSVSRDIIAAKFADTVITAGQ